MAGEVLMVLDHFVGTEVEKVDSAYRSTLSVQSSLADALIRDSEFLATWGYRFSIFHARTKRDPRFGLADVSFARDICSLSFSCFCKWHLDIFGTPANCP